MKPPNVRSRILAAIAAAFMMGVLVSGLLGIWMSDDRWGGTAFLLFFAALFTAAAAGLVADLG